jgi:hypothetical protein
MNNYLAKPVKPNTLKALLESYLSKPEPKNSVDKHAAGEDTTNGENDTSGRGEERGNGQRDESPRPRSITLNTV